ncbi:hypothetical protein [Aequorivita xiaoshiensis]|nr:hypothetical protein [Aequorivita xiaoshiensis]
MRQIIKIGVYTCNEWLDSLTDNPIKLTIHLSIYSPEEGCINIKL